MKRAKILLSAIVLTTLAGRRQGISKRNGFVSIHKISGLNGSRERMERGGRRDVG